MIKEEAVGLTEITEEEIDKKLKPKRRKFFSNLSTVLIIALALAVVPVVYSDIVYTSLYINGASMAPTLNDFPNNRYVEFGLMDKRPRVMNKIKRGDIVIFDRNTSANGNEDLLIKRVIALPFETILIEDDHLGDTVSIRAKNSPEITLTEAYLTDDSKKNTALSSDSGNGIGEPLTLGEGEYYLMGDNRGNSYDSRRLGAIDKEKIIGRLVVVQGYAEEVKIGIDGSAELKNKHYYAFWNWRYY